MILKSKETKETRIFLGEEERRRRRRKKGPICPKNLTFPKAEREQRCPCLVVFIFCLFISM